MFGTKKKQRSALPEKQQLTKYYEMDGALRAYANRMALLGMTCGVFALGTLALFTYVRLQPPVVIRVDNSGEATVVGGDTVKVGTNGLMGLLKVSANGPENSPRGGRPCCCSQVPHELPHVHAGERGAPIR